MKYQYLGNDKFASRVDTRLKKFNSIWHKTHRFLLEDYRSQGSEKLNTISGLKKSLLDLGNFLNQLEEMKNANHFHSPERLISYTHFLSAVICMKLSQHHYHLPSEKYEASCQYLQECMDHIAAAQQYDAFFQSCYVDKPNESAQLIYMAALTDCAAAAMVSFRVLEKGKQAFFSKNNHQDYCNFYRRGCEIADAIKSARTPDYLQQFVMRTRGTRKDIYLPNKPVLEESAFSYFQKLDLVDQKAAHLIKDDVDARWMYCWRIVYDSYRNYEINRIASAEQNPHSVLPVLAMPDIEMNDGTIFASHWRHMRKQWANENSDFDNNYIFCMGYRLYEELMLRAKVFNSKQLEIIGILFAALYHYKGSVEDQDAAQGRRTVEYAKIGLERISLLDIDDTERRTFELIFQSLLAGGYASRAKWCQGLYTCEDTNIIATTEQKTVWGKSWLNSALSVLRSIDKKQANQLPIGQTWFWHQISVEVYQQLPQTGVTKRVVGGHSLAAEIGRKVTNNNVTNASMLMEAAIELLAGQLTYSPFFDEVLQ